MSIHWKHALAAAAFLVSLGAAAPVMAQPVVDDDHDGVADTVDACPDTEPGELVDTEGCSVCPCDGAVETGVWASHDEYVSCVLNELRARKRNRAIGRKAARAVLRTARKSTCGNAELTRCCVYPEDSDAEPIIGQCKVVTVERCDKMIDELPWAEDADMGSCTPNPCVF